MKEPKPKRTKQDVLQIQQKEYLVFPDKCLESVKLHLELLNNIKANQSSNNNNNNNNNNNKNENDQSEQETVNQLIEELKEMQAALTEFVQQSHDEKLMMDLLTHLEIVNNVIQSHT
jgi:hypothetical protein